MWKILFCLISLNYIVAYEYDFLKGFNLMNPIIDREGSYYRLNFALEKDIKISDIITTKILDDFILESVFRFNTESKLFNLLTIGDKYSGHYIIFSLKNTEDLPSIRVTLKENNLTKVTYVTSSKRLIDGQWHKITISFSKGKVNAWLDCEYMENQFLDTDKILESVNYENKEIQHVILGTEESSGIVDFDIQKLKFISGPDELIHIYCYDIPGRNLISRYNPKELDILKMFQFNNKLSTLDGHFYRFNGQYQHNLKLPEIFVSDNINNITFECLFRFNGSQIKDINLIELRDIIYDQSIRFFIGNYDSVGIAENNYKTHNDMFVRVALHNKKIFDGNWHKLVFTYSKKSIQFWVDCDLIRTNTSWFMSPVFFNGISQNITILSSETENHFRDFDIMKLKLRSDYTENLNNICKDIPMNKISQF